jgi:hypothetical protein
MSVEELELETTECLPNREVMSQWSRPRGGGGNRYYVDHSYEDNSILNGGILNGNDVSVGDVNVGNVGDIVVGSGNFNDNLNGNVVGNIFGLDGGGGGHRW